ncbi:TetR/AcrR family transcriptional regulator [Pseudonocardia sp. TRM90224]|uniref:TetR/AcrR family transcriptional regulator n=1 Tax=Pseudonocardia sp. TRM90224 TaxID=2812678 RepID=UPI001E2E33AB|nr:TetR/AcrR family transcriptional regulator [Pseudonocardia sp. TRM90224]
MPSRRYESPVRAAQREATGARIVETAIAQIAEHGLDELTIPAVATAAGLSPATVYRHFPTLDDLLLGVLARMRPRIGQTRERLAGVRPDRLAALARENYASYEEHADVLVPLMESRAFNRVRVGSEGRRAPLGAAVFRAAAPGRTERELEALAGVAYLMVGPVAWRWLRETWGLDAEAASRATEWAIGVLTAAIEEGDPS